MFGKQLGSTSSAVLHDSGTTAIQTSFFYGGPFLWRPVLVKIVIIKLPHKSVFPATVVIFISLLCIFIGGTNFFFEVVAYYFLAT